MSARLLQTVQKFPVKKHLLLSQLPILVYSYPSYGLRYYSLCEKTHKNCIREKLLRRFLTYTTVFVSGIIFTIKNLKDEKNFFNDVKNAIIPRVCAINIPDYVDNRNKNNFIADVVEITAPSVVYIELKDTKRMDFFTGKPIITSNGSGFIVKADGLILTNAHVVMAKPNSNVNVFVRLQDGNAYQGIVEDVDLHSDLATVRINKKDLPVMKLGTSSKLRPGEFVVAIGSPLSLNNTITSGVISSVNRQSEELGLHDKHMQYIQTDAAITFGNSGGPLVNLNGEVIGINAMKVTSGISFAIPIDYAKDFLKNAEERKRQQGKLMNGLNEPVKRRYLGITMLTLTSDIINDMHHHGGNLPLIRHGVLVWKVIFGSPAYLCGLKPGDIITHLNGQQIKSSTDVYKVLEKGGRIRLSIVRNDTTLQLEVEPEEP
ncbi:PREDICTED: serine protease HTRA2, mitochondrial [Ceratosolen solmsi marchali]|uniref:Serine protease HTRA2, mitochondrial n=1 Tax=Ceratosolen solmsi marchali TaxID=326594 RepID=A0AAJ6YWB8_9HYME|nr:PREDICTED: serine protease HTRA2, mitochondrial [Ceratosolen solmsi marchali]